MTAGPVLTFHPLQAVDAEMIAALEEEIYPEGIRNGLDWMRQVLVHHSRSQWPEPRACSVLRMGLEPIGYLLCMRDTSSIRPGQTVLYVCDFAVRARWRSLGVMAVASRFVLSMARGVPAPVEFQAREGAPITLIRNPRSADWLADLGWALVSEVRLPAYMGGEDFYFVRIEPATGEDR